MKSRECLVIVIGPSGVGKSSFIERILKETPELCDIITYSTRSPRNQEKEGDPYHFVSKSRFEELVAQGFFVEWAHVHGNMYGTPWDQIRTAWAQQKVVIMDVDVQGAQFFKKQFPQSLTVFMSPPSMNVLKQRIIGRGLTKDLDVRLQTAAQEMTFATQFDHHLVNDDFESAYQTFRFLIDKYVKRS